MVRIEERKQEAHGDGLDTMSLQLRRNAAQTVLIQRLDHAPVRVNSFPYVKGARSRDKWYGLDPAKVIRARAGQSLNREDVAKAVRGNDGDPCARPLD